jgi:hypothetical protein
MQLGLALGPETRVLCWYLPESIVVREGQQIGVCTKKFDMFAPPPFNKAIVERGLTEGLDDVYEAEKSCLVNAQVCRHSDNVISGNVHNSPQSVIV